MFLSDLTYKEQIIWPWTSLTCCFRGDPNREDNKNEFWWESYTLNCWVSASEKEQVTQRENINFFDWWHYIDLIYFYPRSWPREPHLLKIKMMYFIFVFLNLNFLLFLLLFHMLVNARRHLLAYSITIYFAPIITCLFNEYIVRFGWDHEMISSQAEAKWSQDHHMITLFFTFYDRRSFFVLQFLYHMEVGLISIL